MNKYYTPNLKEFHIGFEYEWKCESTETPWTKAVCDKKMNPLDVDCIRMNDYRVKYLDKEDIESLGFKQGELPYQYFKDTYMLVDLVGNNKYLINQPNLYEDSEFRGTIKNKSELKKLLKQLDIL